MGRKKFLSGIPAGLPIFLVLVVTGFYLLLSTSWSGMYRAVVLLHPVVGVLNAVVFPVFVFSRGYGLSGRKTFKWLTIPVLLVSGVVFLSGMPGIYTAFIFIYTPLYFLSLRRVARKIEQPEKGRVLLLGATYFVWMMVAATGLLMIGWVNRSGVNPIYMHHRWWSVAFLPLLVLFYMVPGAVGTGDVNFKKTVQMFRICGLLLVAVAVAGIIYPPAREAFELHLSTVVLEKRSDVEKNFNPEVPVNKEGYDIVESCGEGSSCHREVVSQHKLSPHNRTLWPSYFRKNLDEMSEEVGEHNTVICGGCHYPSGVIDKEKRYTHFTDGNNCFSCTYCHLIGDVKIGPEKGKSIVKVNWHENHMGMFLASNGGKLNLVSKLDRTLISLDRTGHGRVFSKPLYKQDVYCMSCHMRFNQMNPHSSGMLKPTCIKCHMQPGEMIGMGKSKNNHFFPGASAHLPLFLGDEKSYQRVKDYAEGKLGVNLGKGWHSLWSVRKNDDDKIPGKIPWLLMFFNFGEPAVAGEKFDFRVRTYNSTLGHPFPVASIDVLEAWLEVEVIDERGRVIFSSGGLDENKDVLPGAHRLGGYMIGEDNMIITRNRVWQIKQKVVEREIAPGKKVVDEFSFVLPEDVSGNLTFRARWSYRKFNQDIMRWAYDGKITAPVLTIGKIENTLPVNVEGVEQ